MRTYILIDVLYRTPMPVFLLILLMAITASLLINQILRTGFYTTLLSLPVLVFAGLLGNAMLTINHVTLSSDKASNAALAASFGFISVAALSFVIFRLWARLQDKR